MEYRQLISTLNSVPPPQQPWLSTSMADYAEKLVCWNPVCTKNAALYYQFSTGPDQDDCLIVPDGCVNMLFKCSDSSPAAWLSGIHESCSNITLEPNTSYFGFKPYSTVGMQMKSLDLGAGEIVNSIAPLTITPAMELMWDKLRQANDLQERIKIFQNHAMNFLVDQQYVPTFVEYCAILICVSGGTITLEEIERETGYSQRYCREKFREAYGISIKQYCRIVRIQNAIAHIIMGGKQLKLTDVAYDTGFFDQSHFINEFKRLISLSPSKFRNAYEGLLEKNDIARHEISADASRRGETIQRKGPVLAAR